MKKFQKIFKKHLQFSDSYAIKIIVIITIYKGGADAEIFSPTGTDL
jgi:hypothetical protein